MNKQITFNSKSENLNIVDSLIEEISANFKISDDSYGNILIALTEAVNNAIHHGNKSNPNKMVNLSYEMVDGILTFEIEDEGPGFDFNHLPDPTHPQNIEKPHGRGVFLMKNLSHNLEFFNEGAKVRISFDCNNVVLE
jgi:serine/threonine-protein kinase RsbW